MPRVSQTTLLTAPTGLTDFQKGYSAFIRSPTTNTCPDGIPPRRSKVYEELVFNNTQGFIDKCFPVAKSLFTPEQWLYLVKCFFKSWSCHTPYFSQIPFEFVQFINDEPAIDPNGFLQEQPEWLDSLLHYEWIELEVELSNKVVAEAAHERDLNNSEVTTNPTLMNLQYDWPVQSISSDNIPENPTQTHLLVYRTPKHQVEFIEVNALTSALVNIFEAQSCTADEALNKLAKIVPNISKEQVFEFGRPLIDDLVKRGALYL